MSPDDPRLISEAADGVEEAARKRTVGIGIATRPELGTGSLIHWRGRPYILTAAHVVHGLTTDNLRFLLPAPMIPLGVTREGLQEMDRIPAARVMRFEELRVSAPIADAAADLAAFPIEPELVPYGEWFDLREGGRTPPVTTHLHYRGFPADITRQTDGDAHVAFASAEWTELQAPREGLGGFNPAEQFIAPYRATETHPDAHPGGFSGAALWFHVPTPLVWHPNLELAGVVLAYYEASRLLVAAKRETVEAFLAARLGH